MHVFAKCNQSWRMLCLPKLCPSQSYSHIHVRIKVVQPNFRKYTSSCIFRQKKNIGDYSPDDGSSNIATENAYVPLNSYKAGEAEDELTDGSPSELVDIQMHSSMLQRYNLEALDTQQVLVVQPYFRKGNLSRLSDTTTDLMMAETIGLVETLKWLVVDKVLMGVNEGQMGPDKRTFFGSGQLHTLKQRIAELESPSEFDEDSDCGISDESHDDEDELLEETISNSAYVSAVFVSTFRLSAFQRIEMERALGKPVLDRYNVVLQIFKRHANTAEAKLQIELAEMPYLRARLNGDYEVEQLSKYDPGKRKGEIFFSTQRMALARRERKIRAAIDQLRLHRGVIRKNRTRLHIPSVAIVGYTNAGKTSLIKCLTGSKRLRPRNQLFATLDVTVFQCRLPSSLDILLVDTVGFISDIPTDLIASFNSTLEDASLADVLIHVRDVANPDHVAQNLQVRNTLQQLNVPLRLLPKLGVDDNIFESQSQEVGRNVITVANKIDLLDPCDWSSVKADGMIPVSCAKGYGLDYLASNLDDAVIKATGRQKMVFRISMQDGKEENEWLRKNCSVYDVSVDPENDNCWLVSVILKSFDLARFEKQFLGKQVMKR